MTENALEIRNLFAHVGKFQLNDISFSLKKGTIMGLIGQNGAGKTTLIKTIVDLISRDRGEILYDGIPMLNNEETVKGKIGIVFDSLIYPLNLKGKYLKKVVLPFFKGFDGYKFDNLMKRFELDPDKRLTTFSKGMQMKFGLVMALCHDPDLIILDEPTAGLDPIARNDLIDLLQEIMQNEEKAILFSTHITSDLDKIADYITMIDDGKIMFTSSKEELLDQYYIVHIEKNAMNENIKAVLLGIKETTIGFEVLTASQELLTIEGIKSTRPTIEDIMIYRGVLK